MMWPTSLFLFTVLGVFSLPIHAQMASSEKPSSSLESMASGQLGTFTRADVEVIYQALHDKDDAQAKLAIKALARFFTRDVMPDREQEQRVLDELGKQVASQRLFAEVMDALATIFIDAQYLNDSAKGALFEQIKASRLTCEPAPRKAYGGMLYGLVRGTQSTALQISYIEEFVFATNVTGELKTQCGEAFVTDLSGGTAYLFGLLARLSEHVEPNAKQRIVELVVTHFDRIKRKVSANRLCEMVTLLNRYLPTKDLKQADPHDVIKQTLTQSQCKQTNR